MNENQYTLFNFLFLIRDICVKYEHEHYFDVRDIHVSVNRICGVEVIYFKNKSGHILDSVVLNK